MSGSEEPATGPLQFERAEMDGPAQPGLVCAGCGSALTDTYYTTGGRTLCERCQATARDAHERGQGTPAGRFARAFVFGLGAACLGTLVWYAVRRLTGYELGLIAVGVGIGVGGAVSAGSRGRGGWRYQALAVLLTYGSIVSNYIPDIIASIVAQHQGAQQQAATHKPTASAAQAPSPEGSEPPSLAQIGIALVLLFGLACAAPFLAGVQNIMGLVIIAIALHQAWKLNRRPPFEIGGPYRVGAAHAALPEPVPPPITPE